MRTVKSVTYTVPTITIPVVMSYIALTVSSIL